jgi:hypothetical protein
MNPVDDQAVAMGQRAATGLIGGLVRAGRFAAQVGRPEAAKAKHKHIERNPVEAELWARYQSAFANGANNDEILAITMEMVRSDSVRLAVKVLTLREIFRQNSTLENATAIIEALGNAADDEFVHDMTPKLSIVR